MVYFPSISLMRDSGVSRALHIQLSEMISRMISVTTQSMIADATKIFLLLFQQIQLLLIRISESIKTINSSSIFRIFFVSQICSYDIYLRTVAISSLWFTKMRPYSVYSPSDSNHVYQINRIIQTPTRSKSKMRPSILSSTGRRPARMMYQVSSDMLHETQHTSVE